MKVFEKKEKPIRILHGMSDVAGQGSYSVKGLRALGYEARMIVWRKNRFNYPFDVCLNIGRKKILYPWYAIKMAGLALYSLLKYDVFHFHFGYSLLPYGLDLPFIKLFHKPCFMEYHGDDIRWTYYRKVPLFYPTKELPQKRKGNVRIQRKICKYVDGVILHDEELRKHLPETANKVYIVPLRLNIGKFIPIYPSNDVHAPVIVHAPSDYIVKGTSYIINAIENLKKLYHFTFILVEGVTQEKAFEIYKNADIIIDQLFVGTYGVFALEAMALGKPVITYISDEMKPHFPTELPILNATINNIEEKIEFLLKSPNKRRQIGEAGRLYVETYHDCVKIAQLQSKIYQGRCPVMNQIDAFYYVKSLLPEVNIEP